MRESVDKLRTEFGENNVVVRTNTPISLLVELVQTTEIYRSNDTVGLLKYISLTCRGFGVCALDRNRL